MSVAIHWFRRDLRLDDNPGFLDCLRDRSEVIPLFILDEEALGHTDGSASRWWLHGSLEALSEALAQRGSGLILRRGDPLSVLESLIRETGASQVTWNRCYTPYEIERDRKIKEQLRGLGVRVESFNGALLREPWTHVKADGSPYRVFTPFFKGYLHGLAAQKPVSAPDHLAPVPAGLSTDALNSYQLRPKIPWDLGFKSVWQPGEQGALDRLASFLSGPILTYRQNRDVPSLDATSGLSPHLRFGEISLFRVFEQVLSEQDPDQDGVHTFLKELGWREFAYSLLFHFPSTLTSPLDERFQTFPWRSGYASDLKAWQQGKTGYPIIDAGMRQLWQTGWMHNRVRMIVASFLTKNLLIPWQEGAAWFMDTLVDADAASNTLGWQWTAGCGADAAPYFRVFNPILQGEKFDPDGVYVRRWVPELADVPSVCIHRPFETKGSTSGSRPAKDGDIHHYPQPLVDLASSRLRALERYDEIRKAREAN